MGGWFQEKLKGVVFKQPDYWVQLKVLKQKVLLHFGKLTVCTMIMDGWKDLLFPFLGFGLFSGAKVWLREGTVFFFFKSTDY